MDDGDPTVQDKLAFLADFARHVRAFAAGHKWGGLRSLHEDAGLAARYADELAGEYEPRQLTLLEMSR